MPLEERSGQVKELERAGEKLTSLSIDGGALPKRRRGGRGAGRGLMYLSAGFIVRMADMAEPVVSAEPVRFR